MKITTGVDFIYEISFPRFLIINLIFPWLGMTFEHVKFVFIEITHIIFHFNYFLLQTLIISRSYTKFLDKLFKTQYLTN